MTAYYGCHKEHANPLNILCIQIFNLFSISYHVKRIIVTNACSVFYVKYRAKRTVNTLWRQDNPNLSGSNLITPITYISLTCTLFVCLLHADICLKLKLWWNDVRSLNWDDVGTLRPGVRA